MLQTMFKNSQKSNSMAATARNFNGKFHLQKSLKLESKIFTYILQKKAENMHNLDFASYSISATCCRTLKKFQIELQKELANIESHKVIIFGELSSNPVERFE